jgi:hypothetical protein
MKTASESKCVMNVASRSKSRSFRLLFVPLCANPREIDVPWWFCNCHKVDMCVSIAESMELMVNKDDGRTGNYRLSPVPRVRDGEFIRLEFFVARRSSPAGVGLGRGTVR